MMLEFRDLDFDLEFFEEYVSSTCMANFIKKETMRNPKLTYDRLNVLYLSGACPGIRKRGAQNLKAFFLAF